MFWLVNAQLLQLHRHVDVADSQMSPERSRHFYSTKMNCHLTVVDPWGIFDCSRHGHVGTVSAETALCAVPRVRGLFPSTRHAAISPQVLQHDSVDMRSAVEHRMSWSSLTA